MRNSSGQSTCEMDKEDLHSISRKLCIFICSAKRLLGLFLAGRGDF